MPSKTIDRHISIQNGSGGDVRLAMETVDEILRYREALFRVARSMSGRSAASFGYRRCARPLPVRSGFPELGEAKARDEKMDPDVLWPWLTKMRKPDWTDQSFAMQQPSRAAERVRLCTSDPPKISADEAPESAMEMPRYVSHKKVWALEIDTISEVADAAGALDADVPGQGLRQDARPARNVRALRSGARRFLCRLKCGQVTSRSARARHSLKATRRPEQYSHRR